MKKQDLFASLWIPIRTRLPPIADSDVLVWIYKEKISIAMPSWIARNHAIQILEGDTKNFSHLRLFSHWMKTAPPC